MAKFDIVKEYDWTSMPRGSGMRARAPRVWVKSYKLNTNQILQTIKGYIEIGTGASGDAKSFYEKLYGNGVTSPEDDFNFPYFGDDVRGFTNNFGETYQNGIGGGSSYLGKWNEMVKGVGSVAVQGMEIIENAGAIVDAVKSGSFDSAASILGGGSKGSEPGSYVETPQFYQYDKDSDNPLKVTFVLANTINGDAMEKNKALIKKLTMINRPLRHNSIAVDAPRIYQIKIPGIRFIKWAYCSNFAVKLVGTRRLINGDVIPEGYNIDMDFKSLTMEHAGFMDEI